MRLPLPEWTQVRDRQRPAPAATPNRAAFSPGAEYRAGTRTVCLRRPPASRSSPTARPRTARDERWPIPRATQHPYAIRPRSQSLGSDWAVRRLVLVPRVSESPDLPGISCRGPDGEPGTSPTRIMGEIQDGDRKALQISCLQSRSTRSPTLGYCGGFPAFRQGDPLPAKSQAGHWSQWMKLS